MSVLHYVTIENFFDCSINQCITHLRIDNEIERNTSDHERFPSFSNCCILGVWSTHTHSRDWTAPSSFFVEKNNALRPISHSSSSQQKLFPHQDEITVSGRGIDRGSAITFYLNGSIWMDHRVCVVRRTWFPTPNLLMQSFNLKLSCDPRWYPIPSCINIQRCLVSLFIPLFPYFFISLFLYSVISSFVPLLPFSCIYYKIR